MPNYKSSLVSLLLNPLERMVKSSLGTSNFSLVNPNVTITIYPPTNHTTIRQLVDYLFGNHNHMINLGFEEYHLSDKAIEKILREARDLDVPSFRD